MTTEPVSVNTSIDAVLNYAKDGAPVYRRWVAAGVEIDTFEPEPRHVPMRNGRLIRNRLTLDGVGFTLLDHKSAVQDFQDEGEVARVPHTAFHDQATPGTQMRSSVEYRVTACFE